MTIQSGFFNSINGDRKYDATWFAQYFASFIGNGVFPNPSTGLQVVEGENMNIVVRAGKGWINGYYVVNDSDHVLTLENADGVLKRIDRVVMRLNYTTRQIEIDVKKGEFASNPVAPTLQRDADMYELALADILISNGATAITQANITDTRLNSELCGIVHGVVNQVDTTTIFNQYLEWLNEQKSFYENDFENWFGTRQQEFEVWFASIQDILDGDVAGNLANAITNHINNTSVHIQTGEREKWNEAVERTDLYKIERSGKDSEGTFTMVTLKRRTDDTVYMTSVLSGGTMPNYSTQTITRYAADGLTVLSTIELTLVYDDDGDWTGIV